MEPSSVHFYHAGTLKLLEISPGLIPGGGYQITCGNSTTVAQAATGLQVAIDTPL